MGKHTLLIASGTEDFSQAISDALSKEYRVICCHDGKSALSALRSRKPDLLLLDMVLPELDGLSLLEISNAEEICPHVLAITNINSPYAYSTMERLNVGYIILRPCELSAIVQRVRDMMYWNDQSALGIPTPEVQAEELLFRLGCLQKLEGYEIMVQCLILTAQDPDISVTKVLYPDVAKLLGTTYGNVERNLRTFINNAWKNRDDTVWKEYFPLNASGTIPRPSNAEFIKQLAQEIRLPQE